MDLYIFNASEILITILNESEIIEAKHLENTLNQNTLDVTIADYIDKSIYVIEGNYFAFYDLDNEFNMFEIIKIEDEESSAGIVKKCYCENVFYELRDNIIEDQRALQSNATDALTAALTGSRWSVGVVDGFGIFSQNFFYQSSMEALADLQERWLFRNIDHNSSGNFKFRLVLTGSIITARYVDYKRAIGAFRGKRSVIGKDITSIKRTTDNSSLITACYGKGKDIEVSKSQEAIFAQMSQVGNKTVDIRQNFSSIIWRNDFPTYTNYGFEDMSSWTVTSGSAVSSPGRSYKDSSSMLITDTLIAPITTAITTTIYTVTPGQYMRAYVWVYTPVTISTGKQKLVTMLFYWFTAGVYTGTRKWAALRPKTNNHWELLELITTVPAGIDGVKFGFQTCIPTAEPGILWLDEFHPSFEANKPINQQWIEDVNAKALYGRAGGTLNRFGFYIDDNESNPLNLIQKTWDYLQENNKPLLTYEAKILDLESIAGLEFEKIRLGDQILLLDENFRIPLDVTANLIEITHDLLNRENTDITLGNYVKDNSDINKQNMDTAKKVAARQEVWDMSNAFEATQTGSRIRMETVEGEYASSIKYEDDSTPPVVIGYFSPEEFSYSKIRSDQFIGQNIMNVIRYPIIYYVDSYAGDDFGLGTIASPYKTLTRLTSNGTIPKVLYEDITVHITDSNPGGVGSSIYNESVQFNGILGSGALDFKFDPGVIVNGNIQFNDCTAIIYVEGTKTGTVNYAYINAVDTNIPLRADNCTFIYVRYMWINANNQASYAIYGNASRMLLRENVAEDGILGGITASNGSIITIGDCRGNNAAAGAYGVRITEASHMGTSGSVPVGALGASIHSGGGLLSPSAQTAEAATGTLASPAGGSSPAAQTTATSLVSATASWDLNQELYRVDNDYLYQGSWGFGNHIGLMFFNGAVKFSTIAAAAATIITAVLYIKRLNSGGFATARNLQIRGHDQVTAPTEFLTSYLVTDYGEIANLKWGEILTINMPAQFLLDVNAGIINGLAIYETDGEPFVVLEGIAEYETKIIFKYI